MRRFGGVKHHAVKRGVGRTYERTVEAVRVRVVHFALKSDVGIHRFRSVGGFIDHLNRIRKIPLVAYLKHVRALGHVAVHYVGFEYHALILSLTEVKLKVETRNHGFARTLRRYEHDKLFAVEHCFGVAEIVSVEVAVV